MASRSSPFDSIPPEGSLLPLKIGSCLLNIPLSKLPEAGFCEADVPGTALPPEEFEPEDPCDDPPDPPDPPELPLPPPDEFDPPPELEPPPPPPRPPSPRDCAEALMLSFRSRTGLKKTSENAMDEATTTGRTRNIAERRPCNVIWRLWFIGVVRFLKMGFSSLWKTTQFSLFKATTLKIAVFFLKLD